MKTTLKKSLALLLTLLFSLPLFSQTSFRKNVCLANGAKSDNARKSLSEIAKSLKDSNYSYEASRIENGFLSKKGSTGFVVKGNDGKFFVIADDSILSEYTSADVQFENDDNSLLEYTSLPIVKKENGLVLIALPDDFSGEALSLSEKGVVEGEEITAAGFVLYEEGTRYERRSGIVVNTDSNGEFFVSVPINKTYSGSPLLKKSGDKYEIAGTVLYAEESNEYNVRKVVNAKKIRALIDSFYEKDGAKTEEKPNTEQFLAALKEGKAQDFVSDSLALKAGDKAFMTYESSYDSYLFESKPVEILRDAVSRAICETLGAKKAKNISVEEIADSKESESATIAFVSEKKRFVSEWQVENGEWKLIEFSSLEELSKKKKRKGSDDIDPVSMGDAYIFLVKGGKLFQTENEGKSGASASAFLMCHLAGIGLFYQSEEIALDTSESAEPTVMNSAGLALRFQLPFDIWRFMIVPYSELRMGISNPDDIKGDTSRIYYGSLCGLDLAFNAGQVAPTASVEFIHSGYNDREKSNNLGISFGLRIFRALAAW